MEDCVLLYDRDSEEATAFAVDVYNSLRTWIGVSCKDPQPQERVPFDVKPPNSLLVVTPNAVKNENVREALSAAIHSKRNLVLLHHLRSGCSLQDELVMSRDDERKAIEKTIREARVVVYSSDIAEVCNIKLLSKLNLKESSTILYEQSVAKRLDETNTTIMRYSARVSKARATASVKRKFDLCITGPQVDVSPDGRAVMDDIYQTLTKLAPALSVGRNVGDKVYNANVAQTLNLVIVISKDALCCSDFCQEIQSNLEAEGNLLVVHHLTSCPDFDAELAKCEDKVLRSCIARSTRFTYIPEACAHTLAGILSPGCFKTDDTKSPRTRQAVSGGGGRMATYRLIFKNCESMELAIDGTGEIYTEMFAEKGKKVPPDIDASIKQLWDLYDPDKKMTISWPQFAEVDRIVIECIGGQYSETISRRVYSMMNYPGLTLESEISYTTFHNYHSFIAKRMGAFEGDKDASVHYKYIVDKVKHTKKGKRYMKTFDLFITHDRSRQEVAFAAKIRASINAHAPNLRVVLCTSKVPGKEKMTPAECAAQSLNILVLLQEEVFLKDTVQQEIQAAVGEGAQVLIMSNVEASPLLENEIQQAPSQIKSSLARPPVVEYWGKYDMVCIHHLLELLNFPIDTNTKRPLPAKKPLFRKRDNPTVLFFYQRCDEDTECREAFKALGNLVSPSSASAEQIRHDFLRDGGLEMLQERFSQFVSVAPVAEVAARAVASLAQHKPAARRMAEVGTVKTLVEAVNLHSDAAALNGDACRAIMNFAQDEVAKKKINEHGGFQLMLQSQKRFEYEPQFWERRWGMPQMQKDDHVMVNFHGKGMWCSAKVLVTNEGHGTYDVLYAHGGLERRVPAQWVRPKAKADQVGEFAAVWLWKPNGKLTEDELTLKADGMLTLKSQGLGAAGTWSTAEPKGSGRNVVKLNLSGEVTSIDMERISLTTLRSMTSPHRAVIKGMHDDCLYTEYFKFPEGTLTSDTTPSLLGLCPNHVRLEQQVLHEPSSEPWVGLDDVYIVNFATRWKGLMEITLMGEYTFFLKADTSATFWLDEKKLVHSEHGEQGELTLHMAAGQHRLLVIYVCREQDLKSIELSYIGPDTQQEKMAVPVAALQHSEAHSQLVGKPGFIAEYFPEEYEGFTIPDADPDIIRVEKELDFMETAEAWQGLPKRYAKGFTARYTTYIQVTCGDAKKAKYTFVLESGKKARMYLNESLLVQDDVPAEIELKKGSHVLRVEYFGKAEEPHGLVLRYAGPETKVGAEEQPEMHIVPPTVTTYYLLPSPAMPRGQPLMRHEKAIVKVFWLQQDDRCATVGSEGNIHIWDPQTGAYMSTYSVDAQVTGGCLANQEGIVGLCLDDIEGPCVKLISLAKEVEIKRFAHEIPPDEPEEGPEEGSEEPPPPPPLPVVPSGRITGIAFNYDDTVLASCTEDGFISIWDVATSEDRCCRQIRAGKESEPVPQLAVGFSGDGSVLISAGKEKCMRLWNPMTGDFMRGPDKLIYVGEAEDGAELEPQHEPGDPILLTGHDGPVTCIAFAPKNLLRFATCSLDATIRIWDLELGAHTAVIHTVIDPIQCLSSFVVWSPDEATLVSSNEDIFVQLWSAVSGKPRSEPLQGHAATVNCAAWAPNGQCFITGSECHRANMWHFLINRNIVEIAQLEGEQMTFNADMRAWRGWLMHIRQDFKDYKKGLSEYRPDIARLREALDRGVERTNSFKRREELLGLEVTDYFELDGMIDDYSPYYKLWDTVVKFQEHEISWMNEPVQSLQATEIENLLDTWFKDVFKMIKSFDNPNMKNVLKVAKDLKHGIEEFRVKFPFLRAFANEAILPRHWDALFERMKIQRPDDYDKITLKMMLSAKILEFHDDFEELATSAAKEHGLRKALAAMQSDWEPLSFDTTHRNGVPLLRGIDDIQTVLDDHITKTQAIRSSPFCKPFEERVHSWEATLMYIQDFIDQTVSLQRSWMSLEPIFISDDIKRQLPHESESFGRIDTTFRNRMDQVEQTRNCIRISKIEKIVEDMKECNVTIEKVQKGLKDYLETKRLYFPRFFFLNDADLLSILAETKDPQLVQPHLGKAFEGIAKVRFDSQDSIIEAMTSAEGEIVEWDATRYVDVNKPGNKGAVERWLVEVEEVMMDTLRDVTKASNEAYALGNRPKWCVSWPGQVVICTDCIYWTQEVTQALKASRITEYEKKLFAQLVDIVGLVRGQMTKLNRVTVGAMVTIDVHARDVVTELVKKQVDSPEDFEWLSQLRYYWKDVGSFQRRDTQKSNEKMECQVSIVNSTLLYGFEYLGNTARLVITPLTDRCYRTLMGAFALYYGGAPEGPAGTGKTESTKDLAKALAIQCVVFNCSDSMDYLQLAKFFKGLASSGAWCCFDEFNRISLEVLSVVAQQIQQISLAIKRRVDKFIFEETEIRLVPTCAVNITMNPGYAGRSELPDNLKALFRPCAMMVPNYALIAEIRLYSFGYEDAKRIGAKGTMALKLSSEQLSPQKHYDFGMRGLNALLVAGGNGKRTYGDRYPEDVVALRSFLDVNLPKFTSDDLPLFKGIIGDLFPGVELPPSDYGPLIAKIEDIAVQKGLQAHEKFVAKVIQLWETVMVRHGLMTVGIPPSGKTCVKNVLAETLAAVADGGDMFMPVTQYVMNPKSITQGQLYGESDLNTQEWTDGVLAIAVREAAKAFGDGRRQWVVLDGPVDAIWIENMNTVLDDNKKLCLNSGEIIKLSVVTTMFFEVRDLDYASPATVSRVGVVFLEPNTDLGWKPMLASWLLRLEPYIKDAHGEQIDALFQGNLPVLLEATHKVKTPFPVSEGWLCNMACRLMESFMADKLEGYCKPSVEVPEGEEVDDDADLGQSFEDREVMISQLFWFAMVWTIGACTDADGRLFISDFIKSLIDKKKDMMVKYHFYYIKDWVPYELKGGGQMPPFPRKGLLHDVFVDAGDAGKWRPWTERIQGFDIAKDAQYHTIVVPTADTERNQFMIRTLISQGHNVLFSGPTGTAKTASIMGMLLSGFSPEKYSTISFAFSAQTTANQTQDIIDGKLDKKKKGTFGPPPNKRMLVFIDDLNMPFKETYGAQPPIEILRQIFILSPFGYGWYDRKGWEFRQLVDLNFLAAMCPPGAGKNDVTDRYSRWYNLIFVIPFDEESLGRIFTTVVNKFLAVMPRDVVAMAPSAVTATLEVYATVLKELLPTPAKSHYTFNMRDVSKVFQGICQCTRESLPKVDDLVRVWMHECERVFKDRLTMKQDHMWFYGLCKRQMDKHFKRPFDQVVKSEPIIFTDFVDPKSSSYVEVSDHQRLAEKVQEYLDDYNSVSKIGMNLVLFSTFIQHVCRVVRVLKLPLGNALLVGVGGSGRKSTTTLATYVVGFELFQIEISRGYGMNEWHDDVKQLLMKCGCADQMMVFLFSDTQIAKEAFLEEISSILNTGEVPNLYANEDKLEITERCSRGANAAGKNGPAEIFAWYVDQCRKNLHIVLAMSPIGAAFRNRLRSFPSLVNCCTIDWFMEWPPEALTAVANHFLATDTELEMEDKVRGSVVKIMVDAQVTVQDLASRFYEDLKRMYYVTPTSYLELISSFVTMLKKQRKAVQKAKWRYDMGLETINGAKEQVSCLQIELNDLEPVLEKAAQETGAMKLKVEAEQAAAVEKRSMVEMEEERANVQKATASEIKADCEKDLAAAMPALEAAVDALSKLSKGDIGEVKAMKTPPQGVVMTAQATCIMFEVKPVKIASPDGKGKIDDYWEAAKKELLGDPRLIDRMVNFDKDNIPDAVISKVMPLYNDVEFEPEKIKKASLAAMGICKWVRAMVVYDKVVKEVKPKRLKLEQAEKEVADAEALVAMKQDELKEVMDLVAMLEAQLFEANEKAKDLQRQQKDCAARLARAEKLIDGLGGEQASWSSKSTRLHQDFLNLTGDMLIAAGICAYLGIFTGSYRSDAVNKWLSKLQELLIPASKEFTLQAVIGDQVKIRQWVIDKLPNDAISIDNAIILDNSNRWPLMIDPQMQANKWVKNMHGEKLKVLRLSQSSYTRELESCIQFGTPVLLENVGEVLDAILDPVLQKATFKQGTLEMVRLGDSTIEWSKDFLLNITTKLPNPHYAPEVCVMVALLNFMATVEGLQDSMLGIVVAKEEPETEEKRVNLVVDSARAKSQLKDIEDKILALLSSSTGNILDDEELIETLSNSKVVSVKIEEQVKQQEITAQHIAETRQIYRPHALRCAALFFVIGDLCIVDPMYQFSLDWFITMFVLSIDQTEQKDTKEERFAELFRSFLSLLFTMVTRSLFEVHKLLFSFMLCLKCQETDRDLKLNEVTALMTGLSGNAKEEKPPDSEWLTQVSWNRINALQALGEVFDGFAGEFAAQLEGWQAVFDSDDPVNAEWPNNFRMKCTPLQRALLLFALRTDATVQALQDIIADKLGVFFLEPPPLDLQECYKDSNPAVPLIYILAMGSDPMSDIQRLAEGFNMLAKINPISLGQGQGPKAVSGIEEGAKTGKWVLLQNCHLAPSFMGTLETIVEKFNPTEMNIDFRLWLTACPSPTFPISILQVGVKMTIEPPRGLKMALLRAYLAVDEEWFESSSKPAVFKKMHFGLCFFHGLILERRSFGPVGWNVKYGFSEPDRDISQHQLKNFLEDFEGIPLRALQYMVAEANYGGRVTDNQDRRLINEILTDFYTEEILDPEYKFSMSGIYYAPEEGNLQSYIEYIRALPMNTTPEVFWLHNNANLTAAIKEGMLLLKNAQSMMGSFGAATGTFDDDDDNVKAKSPEETYSGIAAEIVSRMPEKADLEVVGRSYPVLYEQCLNTVLLMELGKFNRLLAKIKDTCTNLGKAVKGLVVFSPELEQVAEGCLTNKIPTPWSSGVGPSYPSLKPLSSYVDDFLARWKFMANWVKEGIPTMFWFSAFFFQQAFLTGVLQNFARRDKIAIDRCTWNYQCMYLSFIPEEAPDRGAYINGLVMDGARWDDDEGCIADSFPKVLWSDMAPIWLKPVELDEDEIDPSMVYQCPIYKCSDRKGVLSTSGHSSNFIMYVAIPHSGKEPHSEKFWTKRGVAFITQTDD